jgi:hypothetical protein
VGTAAQRYLDGRGELFACRIAQAFARDGHGDLLADDIFMLDDGPACWTAWPSTSGCVAATRCSTSPFWRWT